MYATIYKLKSRILKGIIKDEIPDIKSSPILAALVLVRVEQSGTSYQGIG